jgi:TetR/AcrR family transcriptional regulator
MPRAVPSDIMKKLPGAAAVFAQHGFETAKIDDIARAIGVPRATLYYYFAGKEDILASLLQSLLDEVAARVAAAVATPGPAVDRLRAVLEAQLRVLGGNPETAQLLVTNLGRVGRLTDIAAAVDAAFHEPVRTLMAAGASDGSLRQVNVERMASAIFGAVVLVGLHEIVVRGSLQSAEVLNDLEQLLLEGLATT